MGIYILQGAGIMKEIEEMSFVVIFYLLFDARILNVALYVLRRGMYACVRRWAICVRPRGV